MQWKDYFYFTKRERLGLLALILLLFLGISIFQIYPLHQKVVPDQQLMEFQAKYYEFIQNKQHQLDSLQKAKNQIHLTGHFNPNLASSEEMKNIGLSHSIIVNIINYRSKGGTFRKKEDLKSLYSISDTLYHQIAPYVVLPKPQKEAKINQTLYRKTNYKTNNQIHKYTEVTTIDLNRCDTTQLQMIPGIGSYTANKIINYRRKLGGFYSITQLEEIGLNSDLLDQWFLINTENIQHLNINKLSFKELLRHPYLNYEQVKAIFNYKRKYGLIKSIKQLQLLDEFKTSDLDQLDFYLTF